MENGNRRIIFNLPEETTFVEVIEEILKNNGLEEGPEDFFDKDTKGEEPQLIILRDALITLLKKTLPDEKVVEFLAKHLKTSPGIAQKIMQDIQGKLIPFAKIVSENELKEAAESTQETQEDEAKKRDTFKKAKEDLLRKISAKNAAPVPTPEEPPMPYKKNPDIADVEDNAKDMARPQRPAMPNNAPTTPPPPTNNDGYRESVE